MIRYPGESLSMAWTSGCLSSDLCDNRSVLSSRRICCFTRPYGRTLHTENLKRARMKSSRPQTWQTLANLLRNCPKVTTPWSVKEVSHYLAVNDSALQSPEPSSVKRRF